MTTAAPALVLGWTDLDRIVSVLAGHMNGDEPTVIVGVLRGGMVPAVLLAHRLGVRQVRAVGAVRTLAEGPDAAKASPVIGTDSLGDLRSEDVLVVEDVVGTGHTLAAIREHIVRQNPTRVRMAALVVNVLNWAAAHPEQLDPRQHLDLVGVTCAGWVRFPWELE